MASWSPRRFVFFFFFFLLISPGFFRHLQSFAVACLNYICQTYSIYLLITKYEPTLNIQSTEWKKSWTHLDSNPGHRCNLLDNGDCFFELNYNDASVLAFCLYWTWEHFFFVRFFTSRHVSCNRKKKKDFMDFTGCHRKVSLRRFSYICAIQILHFRQFLTLRRTTSRSNILSSPPHSNFFKIVN